MAGRERVQLFAPHIVLIRSQIQDAHIVAAGLLGLIHDGGQSVGKVFEQPILQIDRHAQDAVQEFRDVVVVLVQRQYTRIRFAVADDPNSDQCSGNI